MTNKIYLIDLNGNHTISVTNNAFIGRDHLQNCQDKVVSRKHAVFRIESEKIIITAPHSNPLFYRTKSTGFLKSIRNNKIVELQENDEIGFLPDKFWYRISYTKLDEIESNELNDSETQELDLNEYIECEPSTKEVTDAPKINQLSKSSLEVAGSSGCQKSKLPSWMLNQNYAVDTSAAKKRKPNLSGAAENEIDSTISIQNIPRNETVNLNELASGSNIIHTSNEVDMDVASTDDIKAADLSSECDSPDGNNAASGSSPKTIPRVPMVTVKTDVRVEPADSSVRDSCQFGIKCYRKNPAHLSEFAHPNDSDYRRPNFVPAPSSTPYCPYGNACYRRDPVHFQQFQHQIAPNPKHSRRKLRKRNVAPDNLQLSGNGDATDPCDDTDDDETEYGYTDSE